MDWSVKANRKGGIDPAALAVASLASAISVVAQPGPYGPASTMIGVTILAVIFGYDAEPDRSWRASIGFSAACALISLLALGYPLEYIFASDKPKRLHVLLREIPENLELNHSEVRPVAILGLWLVLGVLCWIVDRRRCSKRWPWTDPDQKPVT